MIESSRRSILRLFEKGDQAGTARRLMADVRKGLRRPLSALNGHPFEDDWMDFAGKSIHEYLNKRHGIVYVVSNPVYRDLYKVGITRGTMTSRLKSLKTAGVVGEFIEIGKFYALDVFAAEKIAHAKLASVCVRHKEFFATSWQLACKAVEESTTNDNKIITQSFSLNVDDFQWITQ